ncbi:ankyrin repeat-containing domain protein [Aspergillus stella-maris]|uniref:ankyrin repeat-containing domain protein n=1 Tax=Aspergillus stella-maris TaxID=1810926 RepID=UPI003CCDB337
MKRRRPQAEDFTIGWICPLPLEYAAAKRVLDELYDEAEYATGRIHEHDIVITCLPAGQMGTNAAAAATQKMLSSFPSIKHGLLVGIAGGVPSAKADIRLGDVVVGQPGGQYGGVVQYDFGKTVPGGFQRTGALNAPSHSLLIAVSKFKSNLPAIGHTLRAIPVDRPPEKKDILFMASYDHGRGETCSSCCKDMAVRRPKRNEAPQVFFGTVASGNQVVKYGNIRDEHNKELGGVLCFEMEAAGVVNILPCLVIRGICDYADSHKNKLFQPFAAAAAATCARQILLSLPHVPGMRLARRRSGNCERLDATTSVIPPHAVSTVGAPAYQSLPEVRQAYLESLRFAQIDSRYQAIKMAHLKTCRWLLSCPKYGAWHCAEQFDQHHGFLWIKGKPGAGKSTIMKFALTEAIHKQSRATVLSFFFNARGDRLEKTTEGMYRSLLLQLMEKLPDLQGVLDNLPAISTHTQASNWNLERLKSLLLSAVEKLDRRPLICFIDALDECDEEQVRDMLSFIEQLGDLALGSDLRLNVCFSSRHYPHVTVNHKMELVLEDQDGHQQDITNYVHSELRVGKSSQAGQIRENVIKRASGVFLWVVLVVKILRKEYDHGRIHELKQRLEEIPDGLHELLNDILTRDNNNMQETLLCLQWILYAKRPLTRAELYFAILAGTEQETNFFTDWTAKDIADEELDRFILDASKGLAEVAKSKKSPIVQFIHESVRDFMRSKALSGLQFGAIDAGTSHDVLKLCCLVFVNIDVYAYLPQSGDLPQAKTHDADSLIEELSQSYPFLKYAVQNIFHHANSAAEHQIPQDSFLAAFSTPGWTLKHNIFERHQVRRYSTSVDKVYLFAERNLLGLLSTEIAIGSVIGMSSERYDSPMAAAVANGNKEAVSVLLASDSSLINTLNQSPLQRSLLCLAAENNLVDLAEVLCDAGINVNSDTGGRKTPLCIAATNNHVDMVKLLLDKNADIEAGDRQPRSPLYWAAKGGCLAVLKLLLERGANIESRDREGRTPLQTAVIAGHEEVVQVLAQNGANIESRDHADWGYTPLQAAVDAGHEAVVQVLAQQGATLEARDEYGSTALSIAVQGNRMCTGLLLKLGADVNSRDLWEQGPLFHAQTSEDVDLLLDNGAELEATNNKGHTPLAYAVSQGRDLMMINRLIDRGANIESRDHWGRTPLANLFFHKRGMVQTLLDRGANIESKDNDGRTPLFHAIDPTDAMILLDSGANMEAKDDEGMGPLSYAASHGVDKMSKFLVAQGADVEAQDNFGRTPLIRAAMKNRLDTVRTMLENSNLLHRDCKGFTAADYARKLPLQGIYDDLKEAERRRYHKCDNDTFQESRLSEYCDGDQGG